MDVSCPRNCAACDLYEKILRHFTTKLQTETLCDLITNQGHRLDLHWWEMSEYLPKQIWHKFSAQVRCTLHYTNFIRWNITSLLLLLQDSHDEISKNEAGAVYMGGHEEFWYSFIIHAQWQLSTFILSVTSLTSVDEFGPKGQIHDTRIFSLVPILIPELK